jgi:hypothetical protein
MDNWENQSRVVENQRQPSLPEGESPSRLRRALSPCHLNGMAFDAEVRKKLQLFLLLAIVVAGGRAAWVVYDRYQSHQEAEKQNQPQALKADYYVTPKKLHPYDLKSARELTKQPAWVKVGYYHTYFPYDTKRRKADFTHEAGLLLPLQKLSIQDVVTDVSPEAKEIRQVLGTFELDGKSYAVPIGSEQGSDFKIYSDDIFFIEDPHDLYKHWPAEVWKAIDNHQVQPGMSELQTICAIGNGQLDTGSPYGSRILHYAYCGKPVTVIFRDDKAVEIKPGT